MRDRVEITKNEYTEYISLQFETYKYLQNKARMIIATTIAGIVAIGSLLSAGYLPSIDLLSMSQIESTELASNTFLGPQSSELITIVFKSLYFISSFLLLMSIITFYIQVIAIYRFTRMNPVITQKSDIILVKNGKENTSERENQLEENNVILSKMYDHYQTSGIVVVIAFFSFTALIASNIMYDEISNTYVILAAVILLFYFMYVLEGLYHIWKIGLKKLVSNMTYVSEEILPGTSDINRLNFVIGVSAFIVVLTITTVILILSVLVEGLIHLMTGI